MPSTTDVIPLALASNEESIEETIAKITDVTAKPVRLKLKLPYFPGPVWKSAEDWKHMQRTHFLKVIKEDEVDNGNFLVTCCIF
jgi:hypothetical protein